MSTKKVSELTGAELDLWVAKAEAIEGFIGDAPVTPTPGAARMPVLWTGTSGAVDGHFSPSSHWEDAGPIIERERLALNPGRDGGYVAHIPKIGKGGFQLGATPLIAAMRAYVASKFGETVEA